jgi:hypothetical protein
MRPGIVLIVLLCLVEISSFDTREQISHSPKLHLCG